jgi:hypothetical protein
MSTLLETLSSPTLLFLQVGTILTGAKSISLFLTKMFWKKLVSRSEWALGPQYSASPIEKFKSPPTIRDSKLKKDFERRAP